MKPLLIFIGILISYPLIAQDSQNMSVETEQEATYPGGQEALIKLLYASIDFPVEALSAELDDEMLISFDVLPDGSIGDVQVIEGVGYGLDQEVTRIMKGLTFIPAVMMGVKIRRNMMVSIPVRTSKNMKPGVQRY